ncbi:MAG: tRNA (guanosine(46)-N7)-methyltransferase TrmB [Gammaproteobacteria bacterium]|nr:tRNA (guanosine(46)-N7)-methyltransferase TrmB [Gammaproteobacteria bacterium]MDH3508052.1 tRNA (guanosine(46)-N7)-methyltransferase TrmB [Gammaproteobacteria bacterium]
MSEAHHRKIRSFVRRPGRTTHAQRRALEEIWPRYGIEPVNQRVDLRALFGRSAPVVLEIGFGNGEALFTSAANHPEVDHLGIEVHEPGIGHLLMLLERAGLDNVRVIASDAVEVLDQQLETASVAVVRLFFPDPWPKKRHHKRRLLQPSFVAELARVLEPGGLLHIATDWSNYAEHMAELMSASDSFKALTAEEAASNPLSARPPTKFERRGRTLGHDVWDLYYRRD